MPCSPQLCFGLFHIDLLRFCEEYYSEGFLKTSLLTGSCQRWCQSEQDVQMWWQSRDFEMFPVPFLKHAYIKNFLLAWTGFVLFLFSFSERRLKVSWNRNCGQFSWFKINKWQLAESWELMEIWIEKRQRQELLLHPAAGLMQTHSIPSSIVSQFFRSSQLQKKFWNLL